MKAHYSLEQLMRNSLMRSLAFAAIPMLFVVLSSLGFNARGDFFQTSVDPEYFHGMNGLVIADRELDVEYIAHPGTPLQYVYAIAARVEHLFNGEYDLIDDFVVRPEAYIRASNKLLLLVIFLVAAWAGHFLFRKTASIGLALMVQLALFGSYTLAQLGGRVIPAGLILAPMLVLSALLIRRVKSSSALTEKERILWCAMVGLGTACKLTFAPIALLPLFFLPGGVRGMLRSSVYMVVSFLIFAYPVVMHYEDFFEWVNGMATHSGMHGTGAEQFVDLEAAKRNFDDLLSKDPVFFLTVLTSSILALVVLLFRKEKLELKRAGRAVLSLSLAVVVGVLFTLKHYAFHYFMPYFLFKVVLIILVMFMMQGLLAKRFAVIKYLGAALVILICAFELPKVKLDIQNTQSRTALLMEKNQDLEVLMSEDIPLVISGPYYGTPFPSFAFMNGLRLCGTRKWKFQKQLHSRFPKQFEYVSWAQDLDHFGPMESWKNLREMGNGRLYVYHGPETADRREEIRRRLDTHFGPNQVEELMVHGEERLWLVSAIE